MTTTVTDTGTIPKINHEQGMAWAATELTRLLGVVDQLTEEDWSRPTDCEGWDVKAMLSHTIGAMEANAKFREFVRQFRQATKAAKHSGKEMIDEMTAAQVRDHVALSSTEMAQRLHEIGPRAVRGRRRTPALLRAIKFDPGSEAGGKWSMGYLFDVIMNRDYWMHRVDLTRATGKELVLTPEHDGRLIADVVAEWARAHGKPILLVLAGPAGGTFVHGEHGEHGEELNLDAIEFCRILSGRAKGDGLLDTKIAF
jgi:uncharacterized protein (TIGR03083 family)